MFSSADVNSMENDLICIDTQIFDIRRRVEEVDTEIGGVTITSTSIETRKIDLQHLRGNEELGLGGLRIEANYHGFCHEDTDIREGDTITPDSGTTEYEVIFIQNLWADHTEFFAKIRD